MSFLPHLVLVTSCSYCVNYPGLLVITTRRKYIAEIISFEQISKSAVAVTPPLKGQADNQGDHEMGQWSRS
jgi:hypothetical protein